MSISDLIQIALATIGVAGSVIGFLVVRSISAADENLSAIRKDVSEARSELTALFVHRQHDRNDIDGVRNDVDSVVRKVDEHSVDIAILKSKVP